MPMRSRLAAWRLRETSENVLRVAAPGIGAAYGRRLGLLIRADEKHEVRFAKDLKECINQHYI